MVRVYDMRAVISVLQGATDRTVGVPTDGAVMK